AYNRAFDASDRLVCEVDPKALLESSRGILKAGEYPKGDSLKNHVDPRTYDYLRRVFRLLKVPETKFARYRPWFLSLVLQVPALHLPDGPIPVCSVRQMLSASRGRPAKRQDLVCGGRRRPSGLSGRCSRPLALSQLSHLTALILPSCVEWILGRPRGSSVAA